MKKWYQWFYLSLGFSIAGIFHYLDGRQIVTAFIPVSITLILGFIQFLCDKNGNKGKKAFRYISAIVIALLIAWIIYLAANTLG